MISAIHLFVLFGLLWEVIAALLALIDARLYGCAMRSCPEQNHTANPNCMLIVKSSLTIEVLTEMQLSHGVGMNCTRDGALVESSRSE